MDTQAVAGIESIIYTTADIGMANTLVDTSRTGMEVKEFDGGYEVDCDTPEQIASFLFLFGGDIRASLKAGQTIDMGSGRIAYDMSGTNNGKASTALISYHYPVCYTPNVSTVLGDDLTYLTTNTPENRQRFANEWLDSEGMMDTEMIDVTNPDGTPVYMTPDTWYGTYTIDGQEYFCVNAIPDIEVNLSSPGDVSITAVSDSNGGGADLDFCYKTVSPIYNFPLVIIPAWGGADLNDLTLAILKAIGR